MQKAILIDVSVLTHRSIFAWASQIRLKNEGKFNGLILPIGYIYFSMLISCLKKIHVEKDDLVLMCLDGRHSWRKDLYGPYKENRQDNRDKHKEVNWEKAYGEVKKVNEQLKVATPWEWLQIDSIEADDLISESCRFFKDRECIIVSIDGDLKMLTHYSNVKYFSLMVKYKNIKGSYVPVDNPLKILSDKIKKGDVSDNILVSKDDEKWDIEIRETIINLLKLPDFVSSKIIPKLEYIYILPAEQIQVSKLPFQNSLAKKFIQIFDSQYKINYDDVISSLIKKKEKTKEKKNGLSKKSKSRNRTSSSQVVNAG